VLHHDPSAQLRVPPEQAQRCHAQSYRVHCLPTVALSEISTHDTHQLCCELCYSGITFHQHSFTIRLLTASPHAVHCWPTAQFSDNNTNSTHQPCCELCCSAITIRLSHRMITYTVHCCRKSSNHGGNDTHSTHQPPRHRQHVSRRHPRRASHLTQPRRNGTDVRTITRVERHALRHQLDVRRRVR
jgi:hypothetical protein